MPLLPTSHNVVVGTMEEEAAGVSGYNGDDNNDHNDDNNNEGEIASAVAC